MGRGRGDSLQIGCGRQGYLLHFSPRPGVVKRERLAKYIGGVQEAELVAGQIARIKGHAGGRFYVNEFCKVFAPKQGDYGLDYVFIQTIDLANWFPKPEIGGEAETAAAD